MLQTAVEIASSLLFPKVCDTCATVLSPADRLGVCTACAYAIQKINSPFCTGCGRHSVMPLSHCSECTKESYDFDQAYSTSYYDGTIKELLHSYKFHKIRSLHRFLSGLLVQFFKNYLSSDSFDAVIAVPMTRDRKNKRGFNQSEILAKNLAKEVKLPYLSNCLERKKSLSLQSSLGKKQRNENIRDSFFVTDDQALKNKKILLIDDIMTTGFTASECAKTLKKSGAASVTVLTVARGF